MAHDTEVHSISPPLLWGWLAARSVARGLPLPIPDRGGMRVDTGTADELRRYVFAGASPEIVSLAASIRAPRIPIKLCGPGERLLAMAPAGWQLQPPAYFMTQAVPDRAEVVLPPGYRIEVTTQGPTVAVAIVARDGTIAAGGYAAAHGDVFVFDRIRTDPGHRRRGLGRALMAALGARQPSSGATRVLVATEAGRALYGTLGWTVVAPYSTIVIPD